MEISAIRLYLLTGLLVHKLVWEILKRQGPASVPSANRTLKTRLLSLVKVVILTAIMVQTLTPEFLPLTDAKSGTRIAGLIIYTLGLFAAVIARMQLGRNWSDIEKSYVQQNHAVVAHGLYRWVRHPIYAGDLLLLIGLELALNSAAVFAAAALVLYVRQQAIREEQTLLQTLPGYEQYYRRTARFLPFLPV
jgi:protein-S-isoprenylcysteine O-methyltransferase Ste14